MGKGFSETHRPRARFAGSALGLILCGLAAAQENGEVSASAASATVAAPTLKTDTSLYHLEQGALQYSFTFTNPTDSVLFLDCQIPPHARMSGSTLVLTFERKSFQAAASGGTAISSVGAGGSAPASGGVPPASGGGGGHGVSSLGTGRVTGPAGMGSGGSVVAGGPVDGGAVNPDDFPPQRVAAHQTFQGQRKLDRVLGDSEARPAFSRVQLVMAYYPERAEGEGVPYLIEREQRVSAPARPSVRKGKAPPPPKTPRAPRAPAKLQRKPSPGAESPLTDPGESYGPPKPKAGGGSGH